MLFALTLPATVAFASHFVQAAFLAGPAANPFKTVDLGSLASMDAFFALLGTDASDWTDNVKPASSPVLLATPRVGEGGSVGGVSHIVSKPPDDRDGGGDDGGDSCHGIRSFTHMECWDLPFRSAVWAFGGVMFIAYGPRVFKSFWDEMSAATRAYRDYQAVRGNYVGDMGDGHSMGPVGRRGAAPTWLREALADPGKSVNVLFAVPAGGAAAMKEGLRTVIARAGEGDAANRTGVDNAVLENEYLFNTASGEIRYQATRGSFWTFGAEPQNGTGAGPVGPRNSRIWRRQRDSHDYTVVVRVTRLSSNRPTAPGDCLSSLFLDQFNYYSEHNRYACVPVDDERRSWRGKMHITINKGQGNTVPVGDCC